MMLLATMIGSRRAPLMLGILIKYPETTIARHTYFPLDAPSIGTVASRI